MCVCVCIARRYQQPNAKLYILYIYIYSLIVNELVWTDLPIYLQEDIYH